MNFDSEYAIDFDQWMELAKRNPEKFEIQRRELLELQIQKAPPARQHRLRCLQWKIDQIRNTAGSTFHATLKINQLMWESLLGKGGLYDALDALLEGKDLQFADAKVISFPMASAG